MCELHYTPEQAWGCTMRDYIMVMNYKRNRRAVSAPTIDQTTIDAIEQRFRDQGFRV